MGKGSNLNNHLSQIIAEVDLEGGGLGFTTNGDDLFGGAEEGLSPFGMKNDISPLGRNILGGMGLES